MPRTVAVPAMLLAMACGGGGGGSGAEPLPTGDPSCRMVLSGALSGTIGCSVLEASYTASANTGRLGIASVDGRTALILSVTGELTAGVVAGTDAADWAATASDGSSAFWAASKRTSTGSLTVTLSSVTVASENGADRRYEVHGTATAATVSASGSSPTTIDVAF